MVKINFCFLFFVFLIGIGSSLDLSISPEEIVFEGKVGEEICYEVDVMVSSSIDILVEDRWAEEGVNDRKLSKHKMVNEELGLEIFYNNKFNVDDEEVLEVCLSGENAGNYHGVLLFKGDGVSAGVGLWLVVNLEEGEGVVSKLGAGVGSITGGVVGVVRNSGGMGLVVLVLLFVFIVMLEVFVLLRVRAKKRVREEV